jgi:hypothetical protein
MEKYMPGDNDTPDQQSPEDKLNAQINAAITGHMKRAEKKNSEDMTALKQFFADQLKTLTPATPEKPEKEGKAAPDPALAAMRAQFEAMQASLAEANAKRERAESKQREDRAYSDLRDSLKAKVRPDLLDVVSQNLFHANKRVEFDADGTALFKVRKAPGHGMPEEDVLMPLADGVANWLSSKEAAVFLPAPGPTQTQVQRGARMPASNQQTVGNNGLPKYDKPATSDDEKIRRAMEAEQIISGNRR